MEHNTAGALLRFARHTANRIEITGEAIFGPGPTLRIPVELGGTIPRTITSVASATSALRPGRSERRRPAVPPWRGYRELLHGKLYD
jgi:hypothetical protein